MAKQLKITALSIPDAAKILASASGREITAEQVRAIAERGDLIAVDGTISLIEYTAFLVRQLADRKEVLLE